VRLDKVVLSGLYPDRAGQGFEPVFYGRGLRCAARGRGENAEKDGDWLLKTGEGLATEDTESTEICLTTDCADCFATNFHELARRVEEIPSSLKLRRTSNTDFTLFLGAEEKQGKRENAEKDGDWLLKTGEGLATERLCLGSRVFSGFFGMP